MILALLPQSALRTTLDGSGTKFCAQDTVDGPVIVITSTFNSYCGVWAIPHAATTCEDEL